MLKAIRAGNISHAYLLSGPGADALATRAAQLLLCDEGGCGVCRCCSLLSEGTHPDYALLTDEKTIKVDAVREVLKLAAERPLIGHRRVIRIQDAHRMNQQAQNALLKTLEEPPENTVFLLSGRENALLPTVVSRCVPVRTGDVLKETIAQLRELGADPSTAELFAAVTETGEEALSLFASPQLQQQRSGALRAALELYRAPETLSGYYAQQEDLSAALRWQAAFFADAAARLCGAPIVSRDAAELIGEVGDLPSAIKLFELCLDSAKRLSGNANAKLTATRLTILAARLAKKRGKVI